MKRWGLVLLLGFIGSWFALRNLKIEQDVIQAVEASRPQEAKLLHDLQKNRMFQDQVHIQMEAGSSLLDSDRDAAMQDAGYEPVQGQTEAFRDPGMMLALAFMQDEQHWQKWLSPRHRQEVVQRLRRQLALPGSGALLRWMQVDPLLITTQLDLQFLPGRAAPQGGGLHVYERKGPLDFDKIAGLYRYLKQNDKAMSFISGDLFALENYEAVQRDIALCTILSLVLNVLVFRWLCRSWKLLGFLLLGTWLSYVAGILGARIFYPTISGLVLAFTSTFLSFNNESLVHLSGLKRQYRTLSIVGLGSAIGTTLIGFLVLLFSDSLIARQMGLISIAGSLAFLAFVLLFQDHLQAIEFRPIRWPKLFLPRSGIHLIFFGTILAICVLPWPRIATNLIEFRYASDYLLQQTDRFANKLNGWPMENLVALPLSQSIETEWAELQSKGWVSEQVFHPLAAFLPQSRQEERWLSLQASLPLAIENLQKELAEEGIVLNLDAKTMLEKLRPISVHRWLDIWNKTTPLNWSPELKGQAWLVFFASPKALQQTDVRLVPLYPKRFYEEVLTDLTRDLGRLFLIGLLVMFIYLIPWQRSLHRLVYIFTPVLLSALCLSLYFYWSDRTLNIVHMMGLALVIAVALDYSSIISAVGHHDAEQSKVLLTGSMTLASFAVLTLAQHPLLRELGVTVTIGAGVALAFALLIRIRGADMRLILAFWACLGLGCSTLSAPSAPGSWQSFPAEFYAEQDVQLQAPGLEQKFLAQVRRQGTELKLVLLDATWQSVIATAEWNGKGDPKLLIRLRPEHAAEFRLDELTRAIHELYLSQNFKSEGEAWTLRSTVLEGTWKVSGLKGDAGCRYPSRISLQVPRQSSGVVVITRSLSCRAEPAIP